MFQQQLGTCCNKENMPGTCYNKSEKAAAWETNVAIQQCCCNCCQSFTWQQQNNCYSWSFFEAWNFTLFVCLCFFFFNVSNRIFYLFLNKCSSDEINGTSILSVLIIVIINHELSIFQCVLGKEVTCGNFSCYWRVLYFGNWSMKGSYKKDAYHFI